MWLIYFSALSAQKDVFSVFSYFAVNNVGFAQKYPEFFAKVPEEVSSDMELLSC